MDSDYCDKHQPGHVYTGRWCVFCELDDARAERDEMYDFIRAAMECLPVSLCEEARALLAEIEGEG